MSKWIENFKAKNEQKIKDRINKLKAEKKQFEADNFDFPNTHKRKAIDVREKEIDELQLMLNPRDIMLEIEGYQERIKTLEMMLAKVNLLANNIEPADDKSKINLRRLTVGTNEFSRIELDPYFVDKVEKGV